MGPGFADVKHFYHFSADEYKDLISTIFFVSAIFFLFKWRGTDLQTTAYGIFYFIFILIIVAITVYIHEAAHKAVAIQRGFFATFNPWPAGGVIGILVSFVTAGLFPLLLLGGAKSKIDPQLRLGKFRYGQNYWAMSKISIAGPAANLILVWLLEPVFLYTQNPFVFTIIQLNLLMAVFSLLPLPKLAKAKAHDSFMQSFEQGTDGLNIFAQSRWVWVWIFFGVLIYASLILVAHIFAFFLATILGGIVTLVYLSQMD